MSQNLENDWYEGIVVEGDKIGRTIGFPTLNLDNPSIYNSQKEGVYSCIVKIKSELYKGALYYGPRLVRGETRPVLEIFVMNFSEAIYGETVSFLPIKFIRGVLKFDSFEKLKEQLHKDIEDSQKSLFASKDKFALIQ